MKKIKQVAGCWLLVARKENPCLQPATNNQQPATSLSSAGFTLVEVMLSLFIALILLVGMNSIFRTTSDTIRAGQALSEATRNSRSVQPILYGDFHDCASDSPVFVISSTIVPQYLNAADAAASTAAGTVLPTNGCELGDHLHRSDMVMFFARGQFKRKTANTPYPNGLANPASNGYLVSSTSSNEAYIHYGHLRMLSNDGVTHVGPDDYAGASEPYAADWVLGRNVLLMMASNPNGTLVANPTVPNTAPPQPELYYGAAQVPPIPWNGAVGTLYPSNVAPLGFDGTSAALSPTPVQSSRFDMAGVSIDQYRTIISNAAYAQSLEVPNPAQPFYFWWAPLVYQAPHILKDAAVATPAPYPPTPQVSSASSRYNGTPPYDTSNPTPFPASLNSLGLWFPRNRFQASTVLSTTPMTSQDQANLAPIFLSHVSQFIVEFAGDFVTQDTSNGTTSGNVMDTQPDGQIDWLYATKGPWQSGDSYNAGDYVIVPVGGVNPTHVACTYYYALKPSQNQNPPGASTYWSQVLLTGPTAGNPYPAPPRTIRWYGMPRDTSGSGHVLTSFYISPIIFPSANELNNVTPLTDVWRTSLANNTRPVPYEVETGPSLLNPPTYAQMKITPDYAALSSAQFPGMSTLNPRYTAVWQNDVPAMVRIVYKVDDPNNTLKDGPTYECVFKLK